MNLIYENYCSPKQVNIEKISCCGEYPYRIPFSEANGIKQCCGTKTYNSIMMSCCNESTSVVKSIGSC